MESIYSMSGISRQGHFRAKHRLDNKNRQTEVLLSLVREARLSHPRMGSRPLYRLLNIEGIGINKFERLISSNGLGIKRKYNKRKTTDGFKYKGFAYNFLNGIEIDNINKVWVSDITYFQVLNKVFYIVIIMDLYSRRILGCNIYENMFAYNNLEVLKQSLKIRSISSYNNTLIHHSDKGSQYMSLAYKEKLLKHGIILSVAENSLQNAYDERINGTLKNDYLIYYSTTNFGKLRKHLKHCVWLYNYKRPHSSIGYKTPVEFENLLLKDTLKEESKMILYDFSKPSIKDILRYKNESNKNENVNFEKRLYENML